MKDREPERPNPKLNEGNCQKARNGLKIKHPTLPKSLKFQFSAAHELHFKHVFKIRGANSIFVG